MSASLFDFIEQRADLFVRPGLRRRIVDGIRVDHVGQQIVILFLELIAGLFQTALLQQVLQRQDQLIGSLLRRTLPVSQAAMRRPASTISTVGSEWMS